MTFAVSRFGDFTLLEDLGKSAVADRYKAVHAGLGGPFFLKVYSRLDPRMRGDLKTRADLLVGRTAPHLAPHLGHGDVGGIPFAVSPWLDGISLGDLGASLRDRRVNLSLDQCVMILGDLARAVFALHGFASSPTLPTPLAHGDVSVAHVRLGSEGQIWLTGLVTPRGLEPGRVPEARFDLAGVGALIYDLVPLLRGGMARPPLPTPLDRVVRRALGIGPISEHLGPAEFADRLSEVGIALKLSTDRAPFVEVVQRTIRAVEKKILEGGGRNIVSNARSAADGIPELVPVNAPRPAPIMPTLEPLRSAPRPAPLPPPPPRQTPPAAAPPPAAPPVKSMPPLPPLAAPATTQPPTLSPLSAAPMSPPPPAPPPPMMPPMMPPVSFPQPTHTSAPRPATMPMMPLASIADALTLESAPMPMPNLSQPPNAAPVPEFMGLDVVAQKTKPRSRLFSDADETANLPHPSAPARPDVVAVAPPPFSPPPLTAPPQTPSQFLRGDTDPDAVRPLRIEAQKELPAVVALLQAGVVGSDAVERAAVEQVQKGGRTLEILVAHGATTDDVVAAVLAGSRSVPVIAANNIVVSDAALLRRIPQTYALARRLLPLSLESGTLVLAVADPFEQKVIDEVRGLLHAKTVDVRVAGRKALTEATVAAFARVHGLGDVEAGGPRILLALHDPVKAEKLGDRLAQEGMQVEHVVDGETAKQILLTRPPQAVICHHDLPGLDGRALLLLVRGLETGGDLPFFVLGPRGDDDLISRVLDLGADDFFGDPLRLDVVLAKLRRAIDKGKRLEVSSPGRAAPPLPSALPSALPPSLPKPPAKAVMSIPPPQDFAANVAPARGAPPSTEFDFGDLPDLPPEFENGQVDVPAMPTGVMGTLRQMALPEIVQSLEMGRKTASVDIVPQDGEKGMIAFDLGAIRYAECGALMGNQAFYALMRHKEGFFRIHYGDAPPAINIDAPTTFLLLEAMRIMDEEGMT